MPNKELIATIYGKSYIYKVLKDNNGKYHIRRNDGEVWGTYHSMSDAIHAAKEKAGPGAEIVNADD